MSFFNKKPTNALEEFIFATYGNPPPKKRANLQQAIQLAHTDLLMEMANIADITQHAESLNAGPIPYSTHDLALSVALAFFKQPQNIEHLGTAQLMARMAALQWYQEGLVAPLLLRSFEQTLYTLYK